MKTYEDYLVLFDILNSYQRYNTIDYMTGGLYEDPTEKIVRDAAASNEYGNPNPFNLNNTQKDWLRTQNQRTNAPKRKLRGEKKPGTCYIISGIKTNVVMQENEWYDKSVLNTINDALNFRVLSWSELMKALKDSSWTYEEFMNRFIFKVWR